MRSQFGTSWTDHTFDLVVSIFGAMFSRQRPFECLPRRWYA